MKWSLIILISLAIISGLVLAETIISPTIHNHYFEDYKIENYSNVLIGAERTHHCSWKPDSIDDGYKICEPEIIIWNKRANPVNIGMIKDNFDFKITRAIRNRVDFYYSTDYEIYQEQRTNYSFNYSDTLYNVSRIRFSNWKQLDNLTKSIPSDKIVGVKLVFELPKYKSAFYNITYKPLNLLLDPIIDACGTLSTANSVYTLNKSVTSTGTCFLVQADNVTLDCFNWTYEVNYGNSGAPAPYNGVSSASYNTTVTHCQIRRGTSANPAHNRLGVNLVLKDNSTVRHSNLSLNRRGITTTSNGHSFFNNTFSSNNGRGIYLDGSNHNVSNNNFSLNAIAMEIFENNSIFSNNTIALSSSRGIIVEGSHNDFSNISFNSELVPLDVQGTNNSFNDIDIWNCTSTDTSCLIVQTANGLYNLFYNLVVNLSSSDLIRVLQADHNYFENVTLSNATTEDICVLREGVGTICEGGSFTCDDITDEEACNDQEGECDWTDACEEIGGNPTCELFDDQPNCEVMSPTCSWNVIYDNSLNTTFQNVSFSTPYRIRVGVGNTLWIRS